MDGLISRQMVIEALNKMKIYRPLDSDRYVISDCLNKIINLPSAQRTGTWIDYQKGKWIYAQCNKCGTVWDVKSNYCPHCGAKMEDEQDGDD